MGRARVAASAVVLAMLSGTVVDATAKPSGGSSPSPNPRAEVACDNTANNPGKPRFCTAPTASVASSGLSDVQGSALVAALGLGTHFQGQPAVGDDGVFRFIHPNRFQSLDAALQFSTPLDLPAVPADDAKEKTSVMSVLNLPALAARIKLGQAPIAVPSSDDAKAIVADALADANIALPAGTKTNVTNSAMELAHNKAATVPALPGLDSTTKILLDTQVSYETVLNGLPVRGPGANASFTLADVDGEFVVTQAQYAVRALGVGERRPVMDPAMGVDVCRSYLGLDATAPVTAQLVYYAPPLADAVSALLPHFECVSQAGNATRLNSFVPAVLDGPRAAIDNVTTEGTHVAASAAVQGGKAPYTFRWTSSATSAENQPAAGPTTAYDVVSRAPVPTVQETLLLTVTDADGLVSVARRTFQVGATSASDGVSVDSHPVSGFEVGSEGGTNSPDCAPYTQGWVNRNSNNSVPTQFHFTGDWAWSSDFKSDLISGGNDHNFVDDVDMQFYCGHGWPDGFTFENVSGPTDKDITIRTTNEARWGDRDLEWIALLSCQVLNHTSTNEVWRWGAAFAGLHQMLGFHTNAYASGNVGDALAKHMHGYSWYGPKKIHESWVQTAKDEQPGGTVWRTLLPVSTSSTWNRDDYFWTAGSVTADIQPAQVWYWVSYSGTV